MDLYALYVRDRDSFAEMKKFVLYEFAVLTKEIKVYENTEHTFRAGSAAFSIDLFDKFYSESHSIAITGEEYNMDLNYCIWFDLFYSEDGSSDRLMMKFMETMIRKNEEECIVLFNGCKSVLERRNNIIVADGRYLLDLNIGYIDQVLEE